MKNDVVLHPIDRLGAIRAQIADLRAEEKEVEKLVRPLLEKAPEQKADGELFHAVLVVQFRESLIADKVRELLHPNTLKACLRVTEVSSVRVLARSTEKVA